MQKNIDLSPFVDQLRDKLKSDKLKLELVGESEIRFRIIYFRDLPLDIVNFKDDTMELIREITRTINGIK